MSPQQYGDGDLPLSPILVLNMNVIASKVFPGPAGATPGSPVTPRRGTVTTNP